MNSILIIAGENSGEKYGAGLVREFKKLQPSFSFYGTGGKQMAAQGVEILFPMEELAVIGAVEILSSVPRILKIFRRIQDESKRRSPRAAVLIDSPDFNLRLANRLNKISVPVLYYVSPTVWAWREGRLKKIKKYVSRMLLIFPFEEKIYKKRDIPHTFVGHPLLEQLRVTLSREEFFVKYGLTSKTRLITLLPGSRRSEFRFHMPVLLATLKKLRQAFPCQFVLARAESLDKNYVASFIPETLGDLKILSADHYEAMAYADLVFSACGTATLETALLGTPLVAFYRLSPLSYSMGVKLMKIKDYSIVNILAGQRVIPELIQNRFTPENLFAEAKKILESEKIRAEMKESFQKIKTDLGETGASEKAARELERLVRSPSPVTDS